MAWPSLISRTKDWGTETLTDADLESQFDLAVTYINDMMDSVSGHKHDATTAEGPKILVSNLNLASGAAGDVLYHNGTNLVRLAVGTAGQILNVNAGATAPEWDSFSSYVTAANALAGSVVQTVNVSYATCTTGATAIPNTDNIPQNTEGNEYFTLAITPTSATNKLVIRAWANVSNDTGSVSEVMALFQDTTAGALNASYRVFTATTQYAVPMYLEHYMTSGTTSSTTFKIRIGGSSGTTTVNGVNGARKMGGVLISGMTIQEIKV